MIGPALLCAVAAVWALGLPSAATLRLRAALEPPASRLIRSLPTAGPSARARRWWRRTTERLAAAPGELRSRRRRVPLRRSAVTELCESIAAELASGRAPAAAFAVSAAAVDPVLAGPLLSPRPREQVPELLERTAGSPGAEGLRLLAACWRISAERGGGPAAVIEGLAGALRDEEANRQEIAAQLAGPRATARMLAALPLLGLAMAAALGAHPLAFLFGTLPGAACLIAGVGLDALGLWWTRRLATAAEVPG